MIKKSILAIIVIAIAVHFSCEKNESQEPSLIVRFKFDPEQQRLNNFGLPSTVLSGNAAQSPDFNSISAHYIELAPTANTQLGDGTIIYHAPETTIGGASAIDFSQAQVSSEGEAFLRIPLSEIAAGNYSWARVSLSYQNYNINIRSNGNDYSGTLASFVGYNTYIGTHSIGNSIFPVNANRAQGYWAFSVNGFPFEGQAPEGATTVPNPLSSTSPIPQGSCVVTGQFANDLIITGNETDDVVITLSLSVNNSFEWEEVNADGKFEPAAGENVIDMGLRGLIPSFTN